MFGHPNIKDRLEICAKHLEADSNYLEKMAHRLPGEETEGIMKVVVNMEKTAREIKRIVGEMR